MTGERSEGETRRVVIPSSGSMYHKPDCAHANQLDQKYADVVSIEEAESQGIEPASCCFEKDLDGVYEDRNLLACALAQATDAPSGWKPDEESPDEWAIVWIETPKGQVSWHVPQEMAAFYVSPLAHSEYDGYDRTEKNERLQEWCLVGCTDE